MSHLTATLLALPGPLVYAAVGALLFLEASAFVGVVVPGETALLVGAVLAARGPVSVGWLVALAVVAAVAGDSVGYAVGRRVGPSIQGSRAGRRFGAERWQQVHGFVRRRGAWAVVLGRWTGLLRALVPTAAGMTEMPYRRFLAANVLGALTWVPVVVAVGYATGTSLARAGSLLGEVSLAVVILVAVGLLVAGRASVAATARRVLRRTAAR